MTVIRELLNTGDPFDVIRLVGTVGLTLLVLARAKAEPRGYGQ
jgi:hypothetical protein